LAGPTGIGFGDGDDATVLSGMMGNYSSVYARKAFNLSDVATITGMRLRMDYDDGFVAYINGQEVTRANMPGGTPDYNTNASGAHEAGTPEEFDLALYTGNLVAGTNVLAIEIHNSDIGDDDLSLIPELYIVSQIGGGQSDTTDPSTPANLTATAVLSSQINLSWVASTDDVGVTGYNIFRGGTPIARTTGTTYQDTGLSQGTLYTYNVSAVDLAGNESTQSSQASDTTFAPETTPPTTPANLTATAVLSSQINLSWDASTDDVGVLGYYIFRDGTPIAITTGITYQDTGLSASTLYTYNVTAVDAAWNESAQSSPDSATTFAAGDTTPPTIPANLTATVASSSQINLSWTVSTDNVGVIGYKIYRDTTLIDTITGTTYQDTGLSAGTPYTYNVSARDAAGNESSQSSQASDTTFTAADQALIDYINDTVNNTSREVKNVLLTASPLSDAVFMALINRDPSLTSMHNEAVFTEPSNMPLTDNVFIAAINKGTLMTDYEWVLEANRLATLDKQLSDNVLLAAIEKGTIMDSSSYGYTLRQNHLINPLTDTVINAAINKGTIMDSGEYAATLTAISPLSEGVLDVMINKDSLMSSGNYAGVLILNSPLPSSIWTQVCAGTPPLDPSDLDGVKAVNPPCP
jgi:chitodextrinase